MVMWHDHNNSFLQKPSTRAFELLIESLEENQNYISNLKYTYLKQIRSSLLLFIPWKISVYKAKLLFIITITALLSMQLSFANTEQINQRIKSLPSELKPEFIDKSPIANLYTLSNLRGSVFIDASGRYLISGDIIDLENMQNIADFNYQQHYAINPKQLPTANALKEVKGNGKRILYIFC